MNKDTQTTEYVDKLKDIKLSDSSRARIESDLLEYARFHGVRVGEASRSIEQVPQRTSLLNLFKSKSMTAAIIAIMLVAGGGTSYAAEGAVPGDFLYIIKTEVNENIKSVLAVSNEAEARLQTKLVKERLEEAEELAIRGELSADTSAELSTRLSEHYKKAEDRSRREAEKGSIETSGELRASLEGTLRSFGDIIKSLNTEVKGNEGRALIADINVYANAQANAQAMATVDASTDIQKDMKDMVARMDVIVGEAQDKLTSAKSSLEARAYARIQAHATEMVAVQSEAKTQLKAELYKDAYQSTQKAIRLAHEVTVMTQSTLRVNAKIKIPSVNVDVEATTSIDGKGTSSSDEARVKNDNRKQNEDVEKEETRIKADTDINVETSEDIDIDIDIDTDADVNKPIQTNTGLRL